MRWGAAVLVVLLVYSHQRLTADLRPHFVERRAPLADVTLEERTVDATEIRERLVLRSTSGLEVSISVRRPEGAPPGAAFILLGGHETGRDAANLVPDARGIVVAAMDYPLVGPRRIKGVAALAAIPRIQDAIRDTVPAIQLVADWLLREGYADPGRLEIVGVSLGAPFACAAGSIDERFRRVWAIHGGGRLHELIGERLRKDIRSDWVRAPVARLITLLAYGVPLAPERWVEAIAPREFVMVNGSDDNSVPLRCVEALFEVAREPKSITWIPGGHVDPDEREILRELATIVLDRIEADDLGR